MAIRIFSRSLLTKLSSITTSSALARSFSSSSAFAPSRLRPLAAAVSATLRSALRPVAAVRGLATRSTSSSLNDPNPNWSNRPPKETILLDGCDFEHWLVVLEKPEGDPTRDEIIDSYIKTLAMVVGSEEEARMKIYSVSTRHYFAFGALVSEELSYKLKELPKVRWVLPDSYLDVKNKDYGGEPFINGVAVPYDPKYHEEWVRNNARAQERNRRNDRPRNFDRSRNFERRRENMQNRDVENRGPPPPNMASSQSGVVPPGPGNFPTHNAPQNNMQPPHGNVPQNNIPSQNNYPQSNYPPQNNYPPRPPLPQNNFPPQNNYPPRPPVNYPHNNFGHQPNYPPQNNMGNFQQPGMNNSAPHNENSFPPQNNNMPPQYYAARTPSNDFQNQDFSGNGPDGNTTVNGVNQNYGPGSGVHGGRPH